MTWRLEEEKEMKLETKIYCEDVEKKTTQKNCNISFFMALLPCMFHKIINGCIYYLYIYLELN